MKIWIFPPLAFVWPSKFFLAFFQFSWPSDVLIVQNHSNLSCFEAILPLKQFLLKIWQSGSVCNAYLFFLEYMCINLFSLFKGPSINDVSSIFQFYQGVLPLSTDLSSGFLTPLRRHRF